MTVNPRSTHPDGGWPFLDPAVSLLCHGSPKLASSGDKWSAQDPLLRGTISLKGV